MSFIFLDELSDIMSRGSSFELACFMENSPRPNDMAAQAVYQMCEKHGEEHHKTALMNNLILLRMLVIFDIDKAMEIIEKEIWEPRA